VSKQAGRQDAPANRGSPYPNSKLQEEQLREIRAMLRERVSHGKISNRFGVSRATISHISRGATWKHVGQDAVPPGRVFAYCRVSSEEQVEGQSLQVQEQQLRGWAMQHGRPIEAVVIEPGVSGGIPFNQRPEGTKLWDDLRQGDVLVAAKLDRMFRSASDCLAVVEAFKTRGVSLYLLDLNGGADDVSGNGIARLFLTIVSAFAEFERDRIGERIRATKRAQKARGEYLGGRAPYGYSYDAERKLAPVPEQQAAIRRIRRLARAGHSPRVISRRLREDGVKLSHVTVRKIVRRSSATNDRYSDPMRK
jgi:DNA invertase Pin-like site-specific DNA recombinase